MTATQAEIEAGYRGRAEILANERAMLVLAEAMRAGINRLAIRGSSDRVSLSIALVYAFAEIVNLGLDADGRKRFSKGLDGVAEDVRSDLK